MPAGGNGSAPIIATCPIPTPAVLQNLILLLRRIDPAGGVAPVREVLSVVSAVERYPSGAGGNAHQRARLNQGAALWAMRV